MAILPIRISQQTWKPVETSSFTKYYYIRMVICLGDTPGGHKGYTCKKYYYYCDKKGSWYDEFRAKCKATCKKGKIYAYLNFWPILYKN